MFQAAGQNTANQRYEQQNCDGVKPGGAEDVEKLQLVVDFRHPAIIGYVVGDIIGVQRALGQQGTWYRA